jgi:hypothetical protein
VKLAYFAASLLVTLAVIAFHLQLLAFSGILTIGALRTVVYHGLWASAIVLTLLLATIENGLLRRIAPVVVVCALAACLTLIHPIDEISRNFLVALALTLCITVLAMTSAPLALLQLSAAATLLGATFSLLDILFVQGFTETLGRAAGLSVNPNVAAAGLLLGAASSFWAVPQRWRTAFVLIVAAAILVTLSRSGILAAVVISAIVLIAATSARLRLPAAPPIYWIRLCVLCLVLGGWIGTAYLQNRHFSRAVTLSFRQIVSATSTFDAANGLSGVAELPGDNSQVTDAAISRIISAAAAEGPVNSLVARGLFFRGALLAYRTGPPLGRGLAVAHALSPHNSFLMFAVAFGHLGWLIPIAFLLLCGLWVRSIEQATIVLATFAVLMTSHDILLVPGLLLPVILGMTALNARLSDVKDKPCGVSAIRYAALATPALFAFGWLLGRTPAPIARPTPALLYALMFGATLLWTAAIWRWSASRMRETA